MAQLLTDPNLADGDGFYERLVAAHAGLDAQESRRLNARLILLLANHVGDEAVIHEALAAARDPSQGGVE